MCHCRTCQKVHGSAFNPFVVFGKDQVQVTGNMSYWESSPGYTRLACSLCGSRIGAVGPDEFELCGALIEPPGTIQPQYESWTVRRFPWLAPLPVPQFQRHRTRKD